MLIILLQESKKVSTKFNEQKELRNSLWKLVRNEIKENTQNTKI